MGGNPKPFREALPFLSFESCNDDGELTDLFYAHAAAGGCLVTRRHLD